MSENDAPQQLREMTEDELSEIPDTPKRLDRLPQYMGNVSMKINTKLGHTNHSVVMPDYIEALLFLPPKETTASLETSSTQSPEATTSTEVEAKPKPILNTIILGADVTHPLKGSSMPSIAAVVGSVDKCFSRYAGSVRYKKGGKEVSIRLHRFAES